MGISIKMKTAGFILSVFFGAWSHGQELKELRHWVTNEHSCDFYILLDEKKIKFSDTLDYYWFKSQQVHVTQGFASGNLLDGPFTKFYVSGQLAASGQFETGLQAGEWKTWFESGQLQTIYNYDEGVLDGNYYRFDESGQIVESGHYRDGKYHGEKIENGEVTKYRNGKERNRKAKVEKNTTEEDAEREQDDAGKKGGIFKRVKKDDTEEKDRSKRTKKNADADQPGNRKNNTGEKPRKKEK